MKTARVLNAQVFDTLNPTPMAPTRRTLTRTFERFFSSEKSSSILLIVGTLVSLVLANSTVGPRYLSMFSAYLGSLSVEHWINDGLMTVFFLLIGLELKREFYNGELSNFKTALLPIFAALGGIAVPAAIHFCLNFGGPGQRGIGIPVATDIAFALGALGLLGSRIPPSLKVFLTALAVMDDLGAIIIIAIFYTSQLSITYLLGAVAVFGLMVALNRLMKIRALVAYVISGVLLWILVLKSGVHATMAGVLLAFAIPFSPRDDDEQSPSHRLEHLLHKPVAFLILPIFALANTGVVVTSDWAQTLTSANSVGIMAGLVVGKPVGITVVSFLVVAVGMCRLPFDLNWRHILGAGLLGGIGFTMSIFTTNLAFAAHVEMINASKVAILLASLTAGVLGFLWLRLVAKAAA